MTSSVPQIEFTSTGIVLPEESAILAGTQADINAAFGGGVNPALSTPQGQIATSYAATIANKNDEIAYIVNQVDPQYASGRMQDAIGNIYFLSRLPAAPTSVSVTLSGLSGTVVPIDAQAIATDGNVYLNSASVTIGGGGSIAAVFRCSTNGPIACPAGSLNAIYQAIPGWDTITNATDGIEGTSVESRAEFEFRREQSVAINARGSLNAVYANVFAVPDVLDVYCTENRGDDPLVVGPVTLDPHSIYVAVVGGDPDAIANAIWEKTSMGCNFNGNTVVTVTDTSGYDVPYPTYDISFEVPTPQAFYFAVTVQNLGSLSNASLTTLIKNAIISAFVGDDGGQRARIGSTIYASRYYSSVAAVAPLAVISIFVGIAPSPVGNSYTVAIDTVPTLVDTNITVAYV